MSNSARSSATEAPNATPLRRSHGPSKHPSPATVRVALVRRRPRLAPEPISGSADIFRIIGSAAQAWDREHFLSAILDGKGRLIDIDEISVGSLTASIVHPREVFKPIILANGAAWIGIHNHPSGDPTPSDEDIALTQRLKRAGDLLGIQMLDHVIIGHGHYLSMVDSSLF